MIFTADRASESLGTVVASCKLGDQRLDKTLIVQRRIRGRNGFSEVIDVAFSEFIDLAIVVTVLERGFALVRSVGGSKRGFAISEGRGMGSFSRAI
jgi:hypothetical protein